MFMFMFMCAYYVYARAFCCDFAMSPLCACVVGPIAILHFICKCLLCVHGSADYCFYMCVVICSDCFQVIMVLTDCSPFKLLGWSRCFVFVVECLWDIASI